MNTPGDEGPRRSDETYGASDETRVDVPAASYGQDEPRRPPAFPSVGGEHGPAQTDRWSSRPPFEPAGGDGPRHVPYTAADDAPPVPVTEPVGGRGGRWRWIVALVATLAVVAVVAGVFLFLRPGVGTPSVVAQYAPADVALYTELRLDLPGDQRDRLVSFMSHFPGFADPQSFDQKLDDTLQQAFASTGTGLDWRNDIDPWFGGQVAVFGSAVATPGTPPSMTFVFSIEDRQRLDELIESRLGDAGMEQEDYKGQSIMTGTVGDSATRVSFAVTDEALIASARIEDLKQALDVRADEVNGLADQAFFTEQLAALHTDRLAAFYYDYGRILESAPTGMSMLPEACFDDLAAAANIKVLGEVRAEADRLAVTTRGQIPSGPNLPPAPPNSGSALIESMPAGAVVYIELRQLGATIRSGVQQMLSCLDAGGDTGFDMRPIEQFLGASPEDYFDFIGDAGLAVTLEGSRFGGGLIATVDDEAVARTRVERLLSAARLAGSAGMVTIEDQEHGDAAITVIRFRGESALPFGDLPSLAVTVTRGRLYIGLDDFVVNALDRAPIDSLASDEQLQAALADVGTENAGFSYVDLEPLRTFIEGEIPPEVIGRYSTEVEPFLEPFSHLIVINRTEGPIIVSNGFLYVE